VYIILDYAYKMVMVIVISLAFYIGSAALDSMYTRFCRHVLFFVAVI